MSRPMKRFSVGRVPAGAPAPFRKSALCRWWRTAPMYCSAVKWPASEIALAKAVLPVLQPGMLCLADRNFFGYALWKLAQTTRADLLWRVKTQNRLPCEQRLTDGSYLSCIYPG